MACKQDYSQGYKNTPTIHQIPCDPIEDARKLRKAMKGMGTDESALISVLCRRTSDQRLQIASAFRNSFGRDLKKDIKSETSGNFKDVLAGLLTPPNEYLAKTLHDAMDGIGTKDKVLMDIICTASSKKLGSIKQSYKTLYGKSLEDDVKSDTSGYFKRLLVSLLNDYRKIDSSSKDVNDKDVSADVGALYKAGEGRWGTDESTFNSIMATRSVIHLRHLFAMYEKVHRRKIEEIIKKEFSGDIKKALLAIVMWIHSPAAYFAKRLNDSMAGLGTKDETLIFIIVSRCEVDLENIKKAYQATYNKTLEDAVKSETSGHYRKALLALLVKMERVTPKASSARKPGTATKSVPAKNGSATPAAPKVKVRPAKAVLKAPATRKTGQPTKRAQGAAKAVTAKSGPAKASVPVKSAAVPKVRPAKKTPKVAKSAVKSGRQTTVKVPAVAATGSPRTLKNPVRGTAAAKPSKPPKAAIQFTLQYRKGDIEGDEESGEDVEEDVKDVEEDSNDDEEDSNDDEENSNDDEENSNDDEENSNDDEENSNDDEENSNDDEENSNDDEENSNDDEENSNDDEEDSNDDDEDSNDDEEDSNDDDEDSNDDDEDSNDDDEDSNDDEEDSNDDDEDSNDDEEDSNDAEEEGAEDEE